MGSLGVGDRLLLFISVVVVGVNTEGVGLKNMILITESSLTGEIICSRVKKYIMMPIITVTKHIMMKMAEIVRRFSFILIKTTWKEAIALSATFQEVF